MTYRIMHKSGLPVKTGRSGYFMIACMPSYYPDRDKALSLIVSRDKDGGRVYVNKRVAEKLMNQLNLMRFKDEFYLEEK